MQMHEADSVEDAAWIAVVVTVRIIAVRVRDHRFRTNLPSTRIRDQGPASPWPRRRLRLMA
jgi:hypothetical protein